MWVEKVWKGGGWEDFPTSGAEYWEIPYLASCTIPGNHSGLALGNTPSSGCYGDFSIKVLGKNFFLFLRFFYVSRLASIPRHHHHLSPMEQFLRVNK